MIEIDLSKVEWRDSKGNLIRPPNCSVCNEEVDVLEIPNPHLECIRKKNQRA